MKSPTLAMATRAMRRANDPPGIRARAVTRALRIRSHVKTPSRARTEGPKPMNSTNSEAIARTEKGQNRDSDLARAIATRPRSSTAPEDARP